ncbi:MAG: hypothetical protein EKK41_07650 [Hyphomicrobiales bacterium]|nr:MAG: hypothetical protein EKK41_07650 [Hyphomicrobiales bacterium]
MFSVGLLHAAHSAVSAIDFDTMAALLAGLWISAVYYGEKLIAFLFTYGKEIIGLLGGAYGILNWWYYRESVLHYRLEKYLTREDARLKDARRDVLYTLARPGERRQFAEPKFAVLPLRKILRRRNLDSRWSWRLPESEADRLLSGALKRISRQNAVLEKAQQNYREQTVTAHILKGVVAALKAQRNEKREGAFRSASLHEFRMALAIPGRDHRLFVLEQIGHQLRCLGMLDAAAETYTTLQAEIHLQPPGKAKDLALARALKWRAVVHQAIRIYDGTPGTGALRAWGGPAQGLGVKAAVEELLKPHAPLTDWDAVEYGDTAYVAAFVAHNLGFNEMERESLSDAATAYASAQDSQTRPLWRMRGKEKMIAKAARAGIKRVQDAQQRGDYDHAWLLPPGAPLETQSDAPQNPPEPIGSGGGQNGVPQTS